MSLVALRKMPRAEVLDLLSNRGLCRDRPTEWWFPKGPNEGDKVGFDWNLQRANARKAKRICEECPMKDLCLAYALEHSEKYGIWGGLTERQRRSVHRRYAQHYVEVITTTVATTVIVVVR